ncbi:MAG: sugar phosphate isomerase/epimerase [Gemmataceae bacterium]
MTATGTTRRQFLATAGGLAAGSAISDAAGLHVHQEANPPPFRLGIVTYNIAARWDLSTILKVCRAVGLYAVELRTTHKHGVEPDISAARRREVRQAFADAGVVLWGYGTVCEFHAPDPAEVRRNIELCKRFVQLAADTGAKGVKVRPNGLPREVPAEKTLAQIGRALRECGQAAEQAGVEIWVEVHGAGTALPHNMKTIMEHCHHSHVGITWNSNDTDLINGSLAAGFAMLRPWIRSCHINELYRPYPWRELFRLLRDMHYDRVTLAEIPGMPDPDSGERLLRYYKALWAELARG